MRGEFKATQIDVTSESASKKRGSELVSIVEKAAGNLGLSAKAKQFASKVIHTLVGAEADLHKTSFDNAHLHEVALVDTAAEILGCAVALDDLGLFDAKIYSTPVAVGGGTIQVFTWHRFCSCTCDVGDSSIKKFSLPRWTNRS